MAAFKIQYDKDGDLGSAGFTPDPDVRKALESTLPDANGKRHGVAKITVPNDSLKETLATIRANAYRATPKLGVQIRTKDAGNGNTLVTFAGKPARENVK